jgi:hypothetical protein
MNHQTSLVSVDLFAVPTIRFRCCICFWGSRTSVSALCIAVTAHPTAEWTAQQLREAFPWESAPRYLVRDRDRIFGHHFVKQVDRQR